jgi:hypothetical protein
MAVSMVPEALRGVFFHDEAGRWLRWHTDKLWALPTPATQLRATDLWWHLELPVWPSAPPSRLFDLKPSDVLRAPAQFPDHWQRLVSAELNYPLELFESFGRWVIMDGYHRLARHQLEGSKTILVRCHEQKWLSRIFKT